MKARNKQRARKGKSDPGKQAANKQAALREPASQRSSKRSNRLTWVLVAVAVAIPLVGYAAWPFLPALGGPVTVISYESSFPASELVLREQMIGTPPKHAPRIANVQIVDFDGDGVNEILACDALRHQVLLYRRADDGEWHEQSLCPAADLPAPVRATLTDIDQDGDRDVAVAVLGSVFPTDGRVGQVVLLENQGADGGELQFTPRQLIGDLRRVADVQPGDLDGDGDIDLVVAEFGFDHGRIFWLENRGGAFLDHELVVTPGASHVPVADFDGDGDLDFAALVSQDEEQVWAFENTGGGKFERRSQRLFSTLDFDFGAVGLSPVDLDQDGDLDLLLTAGDNFEIGYHYPQPNHGCLWLENRGGWDFATHRIVHFGGAYATSAGDLDGDGDLDLAAVSMFNDWDRPGAASVIWLENDGNQSFTPWQIADTPIQLATVACGDLNADGRDDIVAGGLHLLPPFERMGEITAWLSDATNSAGRASP